MKSPYLRTDTKGRVRTPRERREQLLDEFEQTGASAAVFAKIAGLRYSTFAGWVKGRRKEQRQAFGNEHRASRTLVEFVEAAAQPATQAGARSLRIDLPGGAHALLNSNQEMELAAALLRALARQVGEEASC